LFLAAMLVVQAVLFTWVVARSGRTVPGQSPVRFAQTIALDLRSALERDPQLDVARYVREQYAQETHPFFVMLTDGRVVTSGSRSFPEPLIRMARGRLQRRLERPDTERPERVERDGPPFRFIRPVPIMANGQLAGVVVVPPSAPLGFLLRRCAPPTAFLAS